MRKSVRQRLREAVEQGRYEVTVPHLLEELAVDGFTLADAEQVLAAGQIRRRFRRDPRGTRYEVVGRVADGRSLAVVVRFKSTGVPLLVTAYEA